MHHKDKKERKRLERRTLQMECPQRELERLERRTLRSEIVHYPFHTSRSAQWLVVSGQWSVMERVAPFNPLLQLAISQLRYLAISLSRYLAISPIPLLCALPFPSFLSFLSFARAISLSKKACSPNNGQNLSKDANLEEIRFATKLTLSVIRGASFEIYRKKLSTTGIPEKTTVTV